MTGEDKADAVARAFSGRPDPRARLAGRGRVHGPARRGRSRAPDDNTLDAARRPRRRPVPADRRLRVPVRLRDLCAGGAERQRGVAVPAALRLAERVRRDPRPRRRDVPARACRRRGAGGAALSPRHHGRRDELGNERRLDHRPRRPPDRPLAPRGRALAHAPAGADRLRRRPRAAAPGALRERRGAGDARLRAALRLRASRGTGSTPARLPRGRLQGRGLRRRPQAHHGHEPRLRGAARHRPAPS